MKAVIKNPFVGFDKILLALIAYFTLLPAGQAMAQAFTSLYSFTGSSDGSTPYVGVVLSGDTLYGAANRGGTNGNGVVYSIKTNGVSFAVLHDFVAVTDGANPNELTLSGDTLYGTASTGGSAGKGTIFSIKTNGMNFTVLYTFTNSSGPRGTLFLAGNTLYGVVGGISDFGTVFKVNTDGNNFTTLHSFTDTGGEGGHPGAGLILSGNTLYGTTISGSAVIDGYVSAGTIFAIDTDGNNFTTLHSFPGGYYAGNPYCQLVLSGNVLYGTTFGGGGELVNHGTIFAVETNGDNFMTLHNFVGTDGANPYAGLILSGNTLYGTSSCSDVGTPGTLFSVKTDGNDFTTLYSFTGGSDGKTPYSELILSAGILYGTAYQSGTGNNGTVFSLTLPCAPAVMSIAQYAGISVTGSIGCTYEIDYMTNLAGSNWIPLITNTLASNPFLFIDTNSVSGSRFYRAITQ